MDVTEAILQVVEFFKKLDSASGFLYYSYHSIEKVFMFDYFFDSKNSFDKRKLQEKMIQLDDPDDIFTKVYHNKKMVILDESNSNEVIQFLFKNSEIGYILLYPIVVRDSSTDIWQATNNNSSNDDSDTFSVIGIFVVTLLKNNRLKLKTIKSISLLFEQITPVLYHTELKKQLLVFKEKSSHLLANILPIEIAQELEEKGSVEPIQYESLSILFTDFVGFSKITKNLTAEELVTMLDGYFYYFDDIIKKYNIERLKTIGDSYMCVAGLTNEDPKIHALKTCLCALEFCNFTKMMMEVTQITGESLIWDIRVGINTGPAIGGVIGKSKFAFDIWGNNVNIASRMESGSKPGKVNISESTYHLVKEYFETESRGEIEVKNNQKFDMYFIHRIKEKYSDNEGIFPNDSLLEIIQLVNSNS